jgi:GNAT superfamily N-acetyltransferase
VADRTPSAPSSGAYSLPVAVERARAIFRSEGAAGLLRRSLAHERWIMLERRLDQPILERRPRASVTTGTCRPEPESYLALRPGTDRATAERVVSAARWCFGAWLDGRLVHTSYASPPPGTWLELLGCVFPVADDEVVCFEAATERSARSLGVASAARSYMLRFLRQAGYARTVGFAGLGNAPAHVFLGRSGYEPIGTVGWVRLGLVRQTFVWTRPGKRPPASRSAARASGRLLLLR